MNDIFIELSQTTVYGKSAGERNNPLVLGIHGWSQRNGWHTWEPLVEPLAENGFFVVTVDMPGWGRSPAVDSSHLGGQQAVAVIVDIIESLNKDVAVIMGKSWGGDVAIKTALEHPDRVSHLILTAPAVRNFEVLNDLHIPVLLAWAEDDPVIPYAYAERFVTAVPQTRLVSYPTGGHSAAPQNADDFAPKAINFLGGNKSLF